MAFPPLRAAIAPSSPGRPNGTVTRPHVHVQRWRIPLEHARLAIQLHLAAAICGQGRVRRCATPRGSAELRALISGFLRKLIFLCYADDGGTILFDPYDRLGTINDFQR
jgi:hypothetical protein